MRYFPMNQLNKEDIDLNIRSPQTILMDPTKSKKCIQFTFLMDFQNGMSSPMNLIILRMSCIPQGPGEKETAVRSTSCGSESKLQ